MAEAEKTQVVSFRVPARLAERLDAIAEETSIKRGALLVSALEVYVLLLEGGKVVADNPARRLRAAGL